jgi:hypothetical protein
MNLNLVDFSTSLRDLIPSTPSDGPGKGFPGVGNQTVFADKLTALLSPKTGKLDNALGTGNSNSSALEFVDQFKRYLGMAGVVLENATIDQQGLGALNDLLVQAGFNPEEINALMADLKDEDTGLLKLGELMEGLEALSPKESNPADDDETLLAISDLPFITSILTAMGIPEDISSGIIADAKQEGEGINLDSLIDGLQKLQKQAFFSGDQFKADPQISGLDQMFQALGLETKGSSKVPMTLDDFVSALEQMRASDDPNVADQFKGADLFKMSELLKGADNPKVSDEFGIAQGLSAVSSLAATDPEELVSTIMKGVNPSPEMAAANGTEIDRQHIALEGHERESMLKLFGLKLDQAPGVAASPLTQGGLEPELAKLLENVEAVVKEIKNGPGDLKDLGIEGKVGAMAKEQKGTVAALAASGGAGGEFREMAMDAGNQASSKAAPARPILPSYVANQVGKSLARAVSQGETELKLQLKPPELGRLIMTIDNLGNSLKVSVVTENLAARDILASHANELKAHLANSGFSVGSFDVEMGSDFKQSMADARQHSNGSGSKRGKGSGSAVKGIDGDSDATINIRGVANDAGALHFVA